MFKIIFLYALSKILPISTWRKKVRNEYRWQLELKYNLEIKQQKQVADYLHQNYIGKELQDFPLKPEKPKLVGKKIIWQFWGQGLDENTPTVVKTCFNSVKKYKGNYDVIILTNETIGDYIELPDFVYEKLNNGTFEYPFFSDLLRVALLSVYGGVWCDATIYMTDKIPQKLLKQDFFVFQRAKKPENSQYWRKSCASVFNWDRDFKVNILSSFIIAKPNNKVLNEWLQNLLNYWKNEQNLHHYLLMHIFLNEIISKYKNCEIMDYIPPHIMQDKMNKKYSDKLWKELTNTCFVHKLTYYDRVEKNTILDKIVNGIGKAR